MIPLGEKGKAPENIPLFRGHTAAVLDTDWSPFNDEIIASGSDDGKVFLWKVPEDFTLQGDAEEPVDVSPVGKLSGHSRKVGHVLFNPAAENVLASSSGDYTVKLWDLEDGKAKATLKHSDIVQSLSWSADGAMLVTTSRDKKLRFWDVRQEKAVHTTNGHAGAKSSRVVWLGEHDRVATTGFSRMSERELRLWDIRNPTESIGGFLPIDGSSGIGMPFWDDGSQMLYIAGKGDGNISYFEYEHDKFEALSEYKSGDPQRGFSFLPKRGVDTHDNEIMRGFKTVNDTWIEPISFIVPRRSETFQDDIFPPATGLKAAVGSGEFFAGKSGLPPKIDMESLFDGREAQVVPAAEGVKSAPAPTPAPQPKAEPVKVAEEPKQTPAPAPAAVRETPSLKNNTASIATMASRFADKDDEESTTSRDSDNEPSAFDEEPSKPTERPVAAPRQMTLAAERPRPVVAAATPAESPRQAEPPRQQEEPTRTTTASAPAPASAPLNGTKDSASKVEEEETPSAPVPQRATSAAAATGGLREVLGEIRSMIQSQGEQIERLTEEVERLKASIAH